MKKYLLILMAIIGLVLLLFPKTKTKEPLSSKEKKAYTLKNPEFNIKEKPQLCAFQRQEIVKIEPEPLPLPKGDGFKYWTVELLEGYKAYLITKRENPYNKGQIFMVATDCEKPTSEQILSLQNDVNQQKDCIGIYLWDKSRGDIILDCGFMTGQGVLFK